MSEPKRYYIDDCRDERGFLRATDCLQSHEDTLRANSIEVMSVDDHDRIVAAKDEEIAKLKELVKFTAHDIDCDAVLLDEEPDNCQCGLSQVLKSLRGVTND